MRPSASGGIYEERFDPTGERLLSKHSFDANGTEVGVTTLTYDDSLRLVSERSDWSREEASGWAEKIRSYDEAGHLLRETSRSVRTSRVAGTTEPVQDSWSDDLYRYDEAGRLVRIENSPDSDFWVWIGYDAQGRETSRFRWSPQESASRTTYHPDGTLEWTLQGSEQFESAIHRDAQGRRDFGHGCTDERCWNVWSEETEDRELTTSVDDRGELHFTFSRLSAEGTKLISKSFSDGALMGTYRTTVVCGSDAPVRIELDADGDGQFEHVQTFERDDLGRVVRITRTAQYADPEELHFYDCTAP